MNSPCGEPELPPTQSSPPSVTTSGSGGGHDGGEASTREKVKGCKIHALVDTEGLPMRVVIHSAGMQGTHLKDDKGSGCDNVRNLSHFQE